VAYLTAAELTAVIGTERLREIADPNNTGAPDATAIAEALRAAQSSIDSRIGKKYRVPLADPVPEVVRQLMIDLVAFRLKERNRNMVTVEDVASEQARQRMLEDIAAGKVVLDVATLPTPADMVIDKSGPRDSTKTASRDALKGAW
jgi:phage gp36-like protein